MVQKFVNKILKRRHFWRDAGFDELSELYISVMFRGLAISLTGLFVPIYMLRLGYGLVTIMMIIAWYFTARFLILDVASAYTTARIGPKHAMLIGYILLGCNTAMFLTITTFNWPIWLIGAFWGGSASFFFIPFHVDFSKVKHSKHGGKELGYVHVMEKIGAALGPVIGGLVATFFGAQYLFMIATVLIAIGLVPLFLTKEPVKTRQHITFAGLPFARLKRDYLSVSALGVENTLCVFLWPTFLAMFILVDDTVYAKVGLLVSIGIVIGVFAAYTIGKVIDDRKGRVLLRSSAIVNSILHILRLFISTFPAAFLINIVNEVVTVGYRMPFQKGFYDAADELPGYRIAYVASMEWLSSVAKAVAWWFLVLISAFIADRTVISVGFIIAAIASMLVMTERFKALNPRKH